MGHVIYEWHDRVMPHIWMNAVTHMKESRHTNGLHAYDCVMSRAGVWKGKSWCCARLPLRCALSFRACSTVVLVVWQLSHDSLIIRDMTHSSYVTWLYHHVQCGAWLNDHVGHDSMNLCGMTQLSYVTWLIRHLWHDSIIIWYLTHWSYGAWLDDHMWHDSIVICDMTHSSYVKWRASYSMLLYQPRRKGALVVWHDLFIIWHDSIIIVTWRASYSIL